MNSLFCATVLLSPWESRVNTENYEGLPCPVILVYLLTAYGHFQLVSQQCEVVGVKRRLDKLIVKIGWQVQLLGCGFTCILWQQFCFFLSFSQVCTSLYLGTRLKCKTRNYSNQIKCFSCKASSIFTDSTHLLTKRSLYCQQYCQKQHPGLFVPLVIFLGTYVVAEWTCTYLSYFLFFLKILETSLQFFLSLRKGGGQISVQRYM